MADTGSFPIAIPAPVAAPRQHDEARHLTMTFVGMFLLGSVMAAAGLHLESQGYGGLTVAGGAIIGVATAVPAWMLFRHPRVTGRR